MRSSGFMQAMTDLIAPHMEPGSPGRIAVDKTGLFNVNQIAAEIPMHLFGLSGKYGVQVNIVKPDIYPHTGNYYLQLFPVHDEIGFNLPQTLRGVLPENCLPAWCGLSAQIIRNHGFNVPIVHTDAGWRALGPDDADGAEYLEEWVIRPTELDLKYPGTPIQATLGLELGVHFKWAMSNPNAKWAFAASSAGNVAGVGAGMAAALAGGGNAMLLMHGGAMLGQMAAHGLQCGSAALRPDKVVTWAGATFSAADVNAATPPSGIGRITEYPRIWWHGHDGCWDPRNLHRQAEAAVAPIVEGQRQARAIELAEMGIDNNNYGHAPEIPLPSISERYAAQQ